MHCRTAQRSNPLNSGRRRWCSAAVTTAGSPPASYGIALPDNRQYRGLVNRLPALAKERLRLAVFWVSRERDELIVEVES